jgi:hypothetical protein
MMPKAEVRNVGRLADRRANSIQLPEMQEIVTCPPSHQIRYRFISALAMDPVSLLLLH